MSAHGRSRSGRPGRGNASARGGDEGPSVLFFYIYVLMKIAYNSLMLLTIILLLFALS